MGLIDEFYCKPWQLFVWRIQGNGSMGISNRVVGCWRILCGFLLKTRNELIFQLAEWRRDISGWKRPLREIFFLSFRIANLESEFLLDWVSFRLFLLRRTRIRPDLDEFLAGGGRPTREVLFLKLPGCLLVVKIFTGSGRKLPK